MKRKRYVANAESGRGWRVWNRKLKRPWGNFFKLYPEDLLDELNGERRPEKIAELTLKYQRAK
jgi:hypothetical protein